MTSTRDSSWTSSTNSTTARARPAGTACVRAALSARAPCASSARTRSTGSAGTTRFDWDALDAWYEEDEQIFVHPRNPYVRVDALRSHRHVRASLDGVTLADTTAPVLVFETGLPTRYYFDRTDVAFGHLVHSQTQTACPYKGVTSCYWSVVTGGTVRDGHQDLAWAYDFPTRQLLPIAGLVAFYNEKIDLDLDGLRLPRPRTHFFK